LDRNFFFGLVSVLEMVVNCFLLDSDFMALPSPENRCLY
jgi:hypothetical protein